MNSVPAADTAAPCKAVLFLAWFLSRMLFLKKKREIQGKQASQQPTAFQSQKSDPL